MFLSCKCHVTARKFNFLLWKSIGKSEKTPGEISGKFRKFRKFTKIFPEKFPENPRKIGVFFRRKCNVAARKSIFLLL